MKKEQQQQREFLFGKKQRKKPVFQKRADLLTGEVFDPASSNQKFANQMNYAIYQKLKKNWKESKREGDFTKFIRQDPLTGEYFIAENGQQKFKTPETCRQYHNRKRKQEKKLPTIDAILLKEMEEANKKAPAKEVVSADDIEEFFVKDSSKENQRKTNMQSEIKLLKRQQYIGYLLILFLMLLLFFYNGK